MKINKVIFRRCPASFHVIYKDDSGEDKWVCAHGMAICYTCAEFILKQFAWEKERGGDTE